MMYSLSVFVVIFSLYSIGQSQTIIELAELITIRSYCEVLNMACLKKLQQVREGDFTIQDDRVKAYAFCVYKTLGVGTSDGSMDKAAGLKIITAQTDPARFSAAVDACKNETGTTPQNKFWNILVCYNKQYPGDIIAL